MKRASRSFASSFGVVPDEIRAWNPEIAPQAMVTKRKGKSLPLMIGPPPEMMQVLDHAAVAAQWLRDADRIHHEGPREYASIEEMAQKRKDINTRLPYDWCLHLASHGTKRGQNGGFTWKADPRMRLGSPGPFSDETLRAQYARTQRPVMALSGTEEDQWSFLQPGDRARRLAAFPDVEHHPVAGAGHYIHIEQPEETTSLLERFLHR